MSINLSSGRGRALLPLEQAHTPVLLPAEQSPGRAREKRCAWQTRRERERTMQTTIETIAPPGDYRRYALLGYAAIGIVADPMSLALVEYDGPVLRVAA